MTLRRPFACTVVAYDTPSSHCAQTSYASRNEKTCSLSMSAKSRATSPGAIVPDAESSGAQVPTHAGRVTAMNRPVALSSTVTRSRAVAPPVPTMAIPARLLETSGGRVSEPASKARIENPTSDEKAARSTAVYGLRLRSDMSSPPRYAAFVITAPGLERLAASELEQLGARDVEVGSGGVSFGASQQLLYAANLHLRTASRVVIRAGAFGAKAFHELERRAGKIPWEAFVSPNLGVALRVTCRKSRLYHSDAVAERVASAIESRVRGARFVGDAGDDVETPDMAEQLVLVRIVHDECTVSVDSSGSLLHLRGYRQALARAPLRETLAAAALMASGWPTDAPLLDPMCGAGTIPIEGALIARRIPPGLGRDFAFTRWPDFDAATWREVRADAESAILPTAAAPIQGSDRDAGAVDAARANAERASVATDIDFTHRAISAIHPPGDDRGWLVSNPPYGVRVGERDRLRNLYAQLGKVVRAKCPGWRVALVSAAPELERQTGLPLRSILRTRNGGIPVRIVIGDVSITARRSRSRQPESFDPPESLERE